MTALLRTTLIAAVVIAQPVLADLAFAAGECGHGAAVGHVETVSGAHSSADVEAGTDCVCPQGLHCGQGTASVDTSPAGGVAPVLADPTGVVTGATALAHKPALERPPSPTRF